MSISISNFSLSRHPDQDPLQSAQFLLRIFDSFADPLAVYDQNYKILKVNEAMLRYYQRTPEQLAGNHCFQVFYGRNTVCDGCHVQQVFKNGEPQAREIFVSLPDGSHRYFEVHAYPVKDASGATIQVLEHGRDISLRKALELQIKTSEEMYRTIVELAQESHLCQPVLGGDAGL